jgi:hypothetical protein
MKVTQIPTADEVAQFSIRAFKGIEVGLGKADSIADIAVKLEEKYPMHLIFVQAGKFLHGYDRTAHVLNTLKKYKLKLVGTSSAPHIRVGFPLGNHKRRLWSIVEEFDTPYVISLGTQNAGRDVYVSESGSAEGSVLSAVSPEIVMQVIEDLRQNGALNAASAKKMLTDPDTSGFKLKSHAQDLDMHLITDLIAMPRDIRVTWGENVRVCMARIMHGIFAYGLEVNKIGLLNRLSADIDLLKHYLAQAPRLSKLKFAFEHRVSLAVELGRLLGGVMRATKEPA